MRPSPAALRAIPDRNNKLHLPRSPSKSLYTAADALNTKSPPMQMNAPRPMPTNFISTTILPAYTRAAAPARAGAI